MAPTAEIVGILTAETTVTAASKASERALVNMMTVKDSDNEEYAEELIPEFKWTGGRDEAKTTDL